MKEEKFVNRKVEDIELEYDELVFVSPSLFPLEVIAILSSSDVDMDDNPKDASSLNSICNICNSNRHFIYSIFSDYIPIIVSISRTIRIASALNAI